MLLVSDRDTSAFRIIFERYEMPVFNLILRYTGNRLLAQDLLQETFTRVWLAAHSYRSEKGRFRSWMFAIALNITRNEMVKKQYSYSYIDIDDAGFSESCRENRIKEQPEKSIEDIELQRGIQNALTMLPLFLREVVILKHYQQLTFREISRITDTPEGTLKARLHRAVSILRKHFKEGGMDYGSPE